MEGISPKAELMLRALEKRLAEEAEERCWPIINNYEEVALQTFVDAWRDINKNSGKGGARESLQLLATKARLSPEAVLYEIILILWPYSVPPARKRAGDIAYIKRFAKGLRDTAKELRGSPTVGLSKDMYPTYYHPRGAATSFIIPPRAFWFDLSPDVVHLPDMLEGYASFLDNKIRRLKYFAKREPTESQYWNDRELEVVAWVERVAGQAYRARVAAIVRVLQPSFAVEAEGLRKRAQRKIKHQPD
jgi:hypothetical protein